MAKKRSKSGVSVKSGPNKISKIRKASANKLAQVTTGLRQEQKKRVRLHRSFRRSYREDYRRELEVPGIMYHLAATFRILFKNWRVFLPLLTLVVLLAVALVGLMNEGTYQKFQEVLDQTTEQMGQGDIGYVAKAGLLLISTVTTGGLASGSSEAAGVFTVLIFLLIWLVTIFLLRHILAEHKVKLRDALYNAMTPLISTLVVFIVAVIQCVPIFVLIVMYSAAVQTEFLNTPFFALVFFVFAAIMLLTSSYLLSSTLIALVAVSAPGLYPMRALNTASDLMMGRRVKFILRIVALLIALVIIWAVVMVPVIMFDLFMKQFEWTAGVPLVPVCLLTMTCFTGIYITAYLYMYYRWMLNYKEDNDKK